jgi:hypothetical protein
MGLLDLLRSLFSGGERIQCPSCGTEGARKESDGTIRCRNGSCPYFAPDLLGITRSPSRLVTEGDYRPEHPFTIRYQNFQGTERTFSAEQESLVRKGNHIVAQVAPTGRKIALSRDRIQNLSEVESAFPQQVAPGQPWPAPRERQVLIYHKKHQSTSPLFEKIRAKYPNW